MIGSKGKGCRKETYQRDAIEKRKLGEDGSLLERDVVEAEDEDGDETTKLLYTVSNGGLNQLGGE